MISRLRRRRSGPKRLLATMLSLSFGLLASEGLLRLACPQPASWLAIYRRHPRLKTYALLPDHHAFVETGETRWWVHTDARGWRVGAVPRSSARAEVLWLGDSFTFGHGVDYEETWIHQLHTGAAARHEARLAAIPGYGPVQYLEVLRDELSTAPVPARVVACTYLGNDFHDTIWEKDVQIHEAALGATPGLQGWIKRNSHTYRLISRVYHMLASTPSERSAAELEQEALWSQPFLTEARARFVASFRAMAESCAERGLNLRVVVIPTREMVEAVKRAGSPQEFQPVDARNGLLHARRILEELAITYLDPTAELARHEPSQMYFAFDGHLTPAGHRVVAEAISRAFPDLP